MLNVENLISEDLGSFLYREYEKNWVSSHKIAEICKVHPMTIRRWLPKFSITIKKHSEYDIRRIKKLSGNDLKREIFEYNKTVKKIAEECGAHVRTVYRWITREDIKLKNNKPCEGDLVKILEKRSVAEVARKYSVDPLTVRRWKCKAGIHEFRGSRYDSLKAREVMLDIILEELGKKVEDLKYGDFNKVKRLDGNSYRCLLDWYYTHYGYDRFEDAKYHIILDLKKARDSSKFNSLAR
jgi:hypothetical protein